MILKSLYYWKGLKPLVHIVAVHIKMLLLGYDNNPNNPDADDPMLLLIDNSDSPSIVEQLSQGPGLVYNTFIDDSS